LTRHGISEVRGIGPNKSEKLPAQEPGGRYKTDP
jgi:hypothetical protein